MIRTDQPAPEPILLIVGDAIHNLRSALDFAISDIEFLTTGVRDPHTSFPIRDTKDQLVAAVCGGLKKKIPKAVTDHIVNVVQPYRGGNGSSIWSLHALDIEDKHRLLITKKEWSWIRNIHCKDGRGECFTIPEWATIDPHTFTHICTGHQNVQVVDEGKATFSMVFGDDMPFYGKHILPTLRNLSHFVSHTLDSIEHI